MAHQPQQHRRPNDGPPPADRDFVAKLQQHVNLRDPSPYLFDRHAEAIANKLHDGGGSNKTTQIRRFYDELLRFRTLVKADVNADESVKRLLPFIRMINAKAAYAHQRKGGDGYLVDGNFTAFLRTILDQVEDWNTLNNACTLFEAVIGFSPRN